MKEYIGIVAILLSIVSYLPYIRNILKGLTHPHIYSWIVWDVVAFLGFILQLKQGGGAGSFVSLGVGIIILIIIILSLKYGEKDITTKDKVFLGLALFTIIFWVTTNNATLSTILLALISVLGFLPTIRKSWNKPHEETLFTWELNTLRHALTIFALQEYNFVTVFYPLLWVFLNGSFSLILIIRRRFYRSSVKIKLKD